jgi:hypothetical protein
MSYNTYTYTYICIYTHIPIYTQDVLAMLAPECSAREIWRWMKKVWWIVFGCNGLVRSGMQKRSQADRWKTWNFFLKECDRWKTWNFFLLCNRTKPYILAKWKYIKQDLIHDLWVEWFTTKFLVSSPRWVSSPSFSFQEVRVRIMSKAQCWILWGSHCTSWGRWFVWWVVVARYRWVEC